MECILGVCIVAVRFEKFRVRPGENRLLHFSVTRKAVYLAVSIKFHG